MKVKFPGCRVLRHDSFPPTGTQITDLPGGIRRFPNNVGSWLIITGAADRMEPGRIFEVNCVRFAFGLESASEWIATGPGTGPGSIIGSITSA
jgi:hypothetical protein